MYGIVRELKLAAQFRSEITPKLPVRKMGYGSSFMQLRSESEHNERSYKERRDRDKKFGKLYKSVQKHNVKNK